MFETLNDEVTEKCDENSKTPGTRSRGGGCG